MEDKYKEFYFEFKKGLAEGKIEDCEDIELEAQGWFITPPVYQKLRDIISNIELFRSINEDD